MTFRWFGKHSGGGEMYAAYLANTKWGGEDSKDSPNENLIFDLELIYLEYY